MCGCNKESSGLWGGGGGAPGDLEHTMGRRMERGRKMEDGENSAEREAGRMMQSHSFTFAWG